MGHFRWLCLSHSEWLFYKSLTRQLHETQHRVIVPGAPHQTRFLPQRFPCDAAMEMGGSIGIPPIAGWFIRENPMNIDDNWGYPHEETSRYMFGAFQALKPRSQEWFSAQRPHPKREAASLFCNFNDMASVRNTTGGADQPKSPAVNGGEWRSFL